MRLSKETERELLQIAVGFAAAVPFLAGLRGVIVGTPMDVARAYVDLDSHYVYLSGILMGIGIAFWHCIRHIERKSSIFRALCGIVFLGGVCRIINWGGSDMPTWYSFAAMGMEIIVAPAMAWWHMRVARRFVVIKPK